MSAVVDRFLRYVQINTTSDPASKTCPSTACQLDLARLLVDELKALGLQDAACDENGYVMATLPANTKRPAPVIGFMAHLDTSPDMAGAGVKPRLVKYEGGDIVLNPEQNIVMSPHDFPELADSVGKTLVVTDGTTLLGGDDKAGIAEILTAIETLNQHPEIEHGTLKIAFTPDEEIGRGADRFDVKKFGADFGYTVDGGALGRLQFETFNAASAKITIRGRNIHPGQAKNKMVNALLIGMELHAMLPVAERPEYTQDYEGFYLLNNFSGSVDEAKMNYILRDHDRGIFEGRKKLIQQAVDFLNNKYNGAVKLELTDSYFNMAEVLREKKFIVDLAFEAMKAVGVEPLVIPVRGGTDGSRLSFMGLPAPNLFTGSANYHGRYEYVPVESMEAEVRTLVKIAELAVKKQ